LLPFCRDSSLKSLQLAELLLLVCWVQHSLMAQQLTPWQVVLMLSLPIPLVMFLLVIPLTCLTFLLISPLLEALLRPNFIFFIKMLPDEANAEAAAITGVLATELLPLFGAAFSLEGTACEAIVCEFVIVFLRSLGQLT